MYIYQPTRTLSLQCTHCCCGILAVFAVLTLHSLAPVPVLPVALCMCLNCETAIPSQPHPDAPNTNHPKLHVVKQVGQRHLPQPFTQCKLHVYNNSTSTCSMWSTIQHSLCVCVLHCAVVSGEASVVEKWNPVQNQDALGCGKKVHTCPTYKKNIIQCQYVQCVYSS